MPGPFLTQYGTLWGLAPTFQGRVHFVAPAASYYHEGVLYPASDGNDGNDPARALATVAQAVLNAAKSRDTGSLNATFDTGIGDVIILLPGTHTLAANVPIGHPGLSIIGMPGKPSQNKLQPQVTVIGPNDATNGGFLLAAAATDVEFANINFRPVTACPMIVMTAGAHRLHIHDCSVDFETPAASTSTVFLNAAVAVTRPLIQRVTVNCNKAQGLFADITGTTGAVIEDCDFILGANAAWARAILTGVATVGAVIRRCLCEVSGTGAMAIFADGTGATIAKGVMFQENRIDVLVTQAFKNYGTANATLVNNYLATVGGGTGGTLITTTT